MKTVILALCSCSGAIAAILATSSIASPDPAKTIPYPEVMNLKRVPLFDARGIVQPTAIASSHLPVRSAHKSSSIKDLPAPITIDLVSQTVRAAVMKNKRDNKYGCDCPGCRNLAPTAMVLGYSSIDTTNSSARLMMF
jgi:hypothetical protein